MKSFKTVSQDETCALGRKLGEILKAGDVVCLVGDLGTGKTAFTKGIAEALGISGYITSPTFTFVNEYQGRLPMFHFDVYRIGEPEDLFEIGFEEYLERDGVVIIEWADMIKDILPSEYIWVEINKDINSDFNIRIINIQFIGKRYDGIIL
ncbi:MAG TPA: tRNA (adenosine(37)-N6)-threonylcarbamoyltransferase complex ATPase subunit type 1 TsaE [Pseudobacteroides sp.]|nr:tRNA (adenosine(37)-N6)-threonylcarbamoyltransferase complex ATPase subunit type 1 TsaE [Pseudobacteroides sp.]